MVGKGLDIPQKGRLMQDDEIDPASGRQHKRSPAARCDSHLGDPHLGFQLACLAAAGHCRAHHCHTVVLQWRFDGPALAATLILQADDGPWTWVHRAFAGVVEHCSGCSIPWRVRSPHGKRSVAIHVSRHHLHHRHGAATFLFCGFRELEQ